jgi:hypothetical protein
MKHLHTHTLELALGFKENMSMGFELLNQEELSQNFGTNNKK